jgi:hypothetical protein
MAETVRNAQKSLLIIFTIEFCGSFSNNLIKQLTIWLALSAYNQWHEKF